MCDREHHLTAAEISAADARQPATGRGRSGRKPRQPQTGSQDPEETVIELIGGHNGQGTALFTTANLVRRPELP